MTQCSVLLVILLFNNCIISVVLCFIQVNFNPFSIIILLDLNLVVLQPWEIFEFTDPFLECLLTTIIEDTINDGTEYLIDFVPKYKHHYKHDQVEECQL